MTLRRPNTVQVERISRIGKCMRETTTTNMRRGDPSSGFGTLVPRTDKQAIIPVVANQYIITTTGIVNRLNKKKRKKKKTKKKRSHQKSLCCCSTFKPYNNNRTIIIVLRDVVECRCVMNSEKRMN